MAFFNPFRPAYLQDPYPILARLRAEEPVHWDRDLDAWVLTKYEDCLRVLQDDDSFSSDPANAGGSFGADVARKRLEAPLGHAPVMGNSDPPEHTRLRAIVNRGFTPRVIESMRPAISRAAESMLDDVDRKAFDVMPGFAEPLAVSSVLEHLGVPRQDFGQFRQWSLALMRARAEGGSERGVVGAAEQASGEMLDYLAALAERREAAGSEAPLDIVSVLLDACDEESIAPEEMLMMLIHISLAGNGPTAMALGNAIGALAQAPEAQRRLREDPLLLPAALEELLRYDSSTHFVVRFALRDARVGARTIRAHQQVHVMVGAANRDPARFPEPDAIDFERADNRHLSFGFGIHFCLGAPLARLELQIALAAFLAKFGPFEMVDGRRAENYQLRGYQRLAVRSLG